MTLRSGRILALAALVLLVGALAATTVARATPSESLSWVRTYAGPDAIPNPSGPIPVAGALNAVSFTDGSHGWAVGVRVNNVAPQGVPAIDSLVAYTEDGGSSWTPSTVGVATELHGVAAVAANDVWAVGDNGTIVHWDGALWSTRSVSGWTGGKRFNAVSFFDSQNGWAVGDGRGVAYTSDGGGHWTTIATPGSTGAFYGVAARSATSALAVGDSGLIKELSATAATSRATVTGTLYGVTFADADHVWAVGSGAAIYKSSNSGTTWSVAPRPLPAGYGVSDLTMRSVVFFNPYDGVIVGTYQTVWRTSNGGADWVADQIADPTTGDDYELRGVAFAGAVAAPVTVGRAYGGQLNSSTQKARAYLGSWVGIPAQVPFAPSGVTAADGGAPRPRITVTWADNSADEDGFVIERSQGSASGPWDTLATLGAGVTSFTDGAVDWTSSWYYRVRSFRAALSSDWAVSAPFAVDAIPPTTTSDMKSAYVASAMVTFSASDNAGGSGVSHTYHILDGAPQAEGASVSTSVLGSHTLSFWSVDVAGNAEPHHTAGFSVVDGINTFVITKTAGAGGSISGPDTVSSGADASYSITPSAGHHVLDVVVDGSSVGAVSSYQFLAVTASHTISATFEGNTFTVTSSNGMNGSISPLGVSAPITYGADSATYTITPAPGSVISNVVVDGVPVGKISAYKFTDVRADHTIRATFMRVTALTITSNRTTSTGGRTIVFSGTISPNMKNGTHVIVEWIKSGAHSWTRLASYVDTFSSHHWSYTLSTRTRSHGTYFVRVRYAGGTTFLPCSSISRKIVIR
jgi:photosystem II stability/assembly factor-like uncharacterized protein